MLYQTKCKICRRRGQKLFLKGERCFSQKCAMIKRPYLPGLHGRSRRAGRLSEYGRQLMEKQKIRHTYGLSETQFKNYFKQIAAKKGDRAGFLLKQLESRLDNVVFRLGWASSRRLARQIISHGHIIINNRRTNIPSFRVKKGDEVKIREGSKKLTWFKNLKITLKKYKAPAWLSLGKEKFSAKITAEPEIGEVMKSGDMAMIIEYYSR